MIENFLNRFLKTIGKKPTTVSCSSVQYSIPLTKKQITGMLIWYVMLQREKQVEIYLGLLLTFNLKDAK